MADFLVLGGGMIGISTALALQERGHAVVVVDRAQVGRETSYGNAGIIQAEATEPYPMPRDLPTLAKMGLGLTNDLVWSLKGLYDMAPTLLRYHHHSAPQRHRQLSSIYAQLTMRSTKDHEKWIGQAGAQDLISQSGHYCLYRDAKSLDEAIADAERMMAVYDVRASFLSGADYLGREPAMIAPPEGAVHWRDSWHCADPGGLVQAYAALFQQRGGQVLSGAAESLAAHGQGWQVETADGPLRAGSVIIALGPWAPKFLYRFGYRIPMVYKRGYHWHYANPKRLNAPFLDAAHGIVAAQMNQGLRLLSGAALVAHDASSNPRQLVRGARGVGELLALGERLDEPQWFGTRPCMPDMLPVIGPAPQHGNMWFNFGHGHQGFTLGPTAARLLAGAIADDGATTDLLAALSPQRFL